MHTECATPDSAIVSSFQEIEWQREEIDATSNQINHGEQAQPDTANEGGFPLAHVTVDRLLEPPPYEEVVALPSITPQPASDSSINTTNTSNHYLNFLYDNDLYVENDNSEPPPPYSKYDSVPSLTVDFEPDIGRIRVRETNSDTLVLIDESASNEERIRPITSTKMAGTFSLAFCAVFIVMIFYGSDFSHQNFGFHECLFVAVHFGAIYLATRNL